MPDTFGRTAKYDTDDTIIAISSPSHEQRVIIRITGPAAFEISRRFFRSHAGRPDFGARQQVTTGSIDIDPEIEVEASLYAFPSPNSYTGDDVTEFHLYTNASVTQALLANLLEHGARMAEPGEFTARAFLNGKMDLSQAEAVNEIIVSSNKFQLDAAEKLLSGQLSATTAKICSQILECLSLIEAGLDFSGEDIEFITPEETIEKLAGIKNQLGNLLSGSLRNESVIDLPAVGIAGAPNAGKSTLVNKLLGSERSIVSHRHKTTRDVLTGPLELENCNCILFDCAGLLVNPEDILDELAQEAATEAIRNSAVVVFCIDISKSNWLEDLSIRKLIEPKILIPAATKCDMLSAKVLPERLAELNELFGLDFLAISAKSGEGLVQLRQIIDSHLVRHQTYAESPLAITARHKQAVNAAIAALDDTAGELSAGNDEITAMMLRSAYKSVSEIEQHDPAMDEQILEQIFSRFCIGK